MDPVCDEFRALSEEEILKALGEPEENAVMQELSRILDGMTQEYMRLKRQGLSAEPLLQKPPSCALEKFALEMMAEVVRANPAKAF
jgi:hypothetical protein